MKHSKKDRTVYDIEEIHCGNEIIYKVKNLATNQEHSEESINGYVKCETPEDRMIIEINELENKISKLSAFLNTEKFNSLSDEHQSLLIKQDTVMKSYRDILRRRLELM